MDFFENLRTRRTVRSFTGAAIPKADLEQIVDAARLGPSGKNHQPWDFIVITQPETIQAFKPLGDWIDQAGAVIAVVSDPVSRWWVEDSAVAAYGLLLAANALGYSGCWLEGRTREHESDLKAMLGIPEGLRLFTLIPLGVAAEHPEKEKKALQHVLHWEKF